MGHILLDIMVTHYLLFLISNELPAQVKQRVDHACAGDIAAPKILHYQMRRLANINYIIPVKAALHMMGLYFPHPLFRTVPTPAKLVDLGIEWVGDQLPT